MFISEYNEKDKLLSKTIGTIFKHRKLLNNPNEISFRIYYWRKSNAIHKWFVDHVQNGVDDCKNYYVSWENLQGLLDAINNVLGKDAKEKLANELSGKYNTEYLPIAKGFFFGDTEYGEWYISDLKETKEMLENLIKNKKEYEDISFEYTSSW